MFLFSCCQSVKSKRGYQVHKDNNLNFFNQLSDIDEKDRNNGAVQILKVDISDYEDIIKEFKGTNKKWTDIEFPPNEDSLGVISGVNGSQWKRISDLVHKPVLFDGVISPKDIIQGNQECYFLSALASLAEQPQLIQKVFGKQTYNPNGIYKVTLRIDGVIQEILVDDFVPVNSNGDPLFCQPNKNEFWALILEKAWAKAHKNYANIISGYPHEVYKAVTYAPVETYIIKDREDDIERIWRVIIENINKGYPACCSTYGSEEVEWQGIELVPNQAYSLINATEVKHKNGKSYRILVLRNPWKSYNWQGDASENDTNFWDCIIESSEKNVYNSMRKKSNEGIFFITYTDFCKYFVEIYFSMTEKFANYISEPIFSNKKNGLLYSINIDKQGQYLFELHQSSIKGEDLERIEDGLCRSTLIVAKIVEDGKKYEFIDGSLKYNLEDTIVKATLNPGKYIIFAKLDPTRVKNLLPEDASLSVYSSSFVELKPEKRIEHPDILQKMFLNHAKLNKKQSYNNDLMWISWKLLFQQGGYAYIAFGNSFESDKKFVITLDESKFENLNFSLKKEFKRKGEGQILEILPGEEKIILARVKNLSVTGFKFPPDISIKMEKIKSG